MINSYSDSDNITKQTLLDDAEQEVEKSLRPDSFSEIVGRQVEKDNLNMMIESAKKRSKPLDHVLFHGPPGLGKTSFAMVIAKEMGVPFLVTTGPAITKAGDLASLLTSLENNSILFIDEVHRLRHQIEEILYPAMEDRVIDVTLGKGMGAKTLRLDLPEFTIIAATTKLSMLSSPLRDRFGAEFRLDFYKPEELTQIVIQKADKMNMNISEIAATLIANRARLTARIAIRLLKRARDWAVVHNLSEISEDAVRNTLISLDIDELGLDATDRKILHNLYSRFSGKPVGLNTLAASVAEEASTIEDVYEPYLIRLGFIEKNSRGRALTDTALKYIESNLSNI